MGRQGIATWLGVVGAVMAAAGCQTVGPATPQAKVADPAEITALEGQFAELSRRQGARSAFLAFLAADSVVLQPGPVPGQATWQAAGELPGILDWSPDAVGMARDGALGFSTGPWQLTPPDAARPSVEGRYLTVWRRVAGAWKVVFDGGWGRRAAGDPAIERVTPRVLTGACEPGPPVSTADLQSRDRGLTGSAQLRPQGGAVASSGDLGYTFGVSAPSPDTPPDASYGHIWCRHAGRWQLLLELRRPLPAPSPPPKESHVNQ